MLLAVILAAGVLHPFTLSAPPAAHANPPAEVASVQTDPLYQAAAQDYSRRRYSDALSLLNTLGKAPTYQHNPAAQQFLLRQTRICRRALGLKDIPAPAALLASSPPRQADCGPRALLLVCRNNGIPAQLSVLKRQAGTTANGTTLLGLAAAARQNGWKASGVQMDARALSQLSRPALAWVDGDHYVAVLRVQDGLATIQDPNLPHAEALPTAQLWSRCAGILLTLQHS